MIVIGDVMIDSYLTGEVSRISPEAPVPIVLNADKQTFLGGAGNLASNLAGLNLSVELICQYSVEDNALIEQLCDGKDINVLNINESCPTSTHKVRIIAGVQQLLRLDYESYTPVSSSSILDKVPDNSFVFLSDYNKGMLFEARELIVNLNKKGCKIFVDPKTTDLESYADCYLLKPNEKEFEALIQKTKYASLGLKSQMLAAQNEYRIRNLVVTLGPNGAIGVDQNGNFYEQRSKAVSVYDVTGAGDTYFACLGASLSETDDLERAMSFAAYQAGKAVSTKGLYVPQDTPQENVVFTNGCFDVLHYGHISYLRYAKSLGDKLIVGINDDSYIRRAKNREPIHLLAQRKEMLSYLDFVDEVIVFSEETPIDLIRKIKPNILVKGSDYTEEEIVGAEYVKSYGGSVIRAPFVEGFSSSAIVGKKK